MPLSLEVGALFRIQDDATPTLRLLTEGAIAFATAVENAEKGLGTLGRVTLTGLTDSVAGAERTVLSLNNAAKTSAEQISASFASAATGVQALIGEVNTLIARLGEAAAASNGIGGGGRGGGGPGPRVAPSFGGGRPIIPRTPEEDPFAIPPPPRPWGTQNPTLRYGPNTPVGRGGAMGIGAGMAGRGIGIAEMIEAYGVYEAYKMASAQQLGQGYALMDMGYQTGTPEYAAAMDQLGGLSRTATANTIFPEWEAGKSMAAAAGMLGYGGDTPEARAIAMQKFQAIVPTTMKTAEYLQQRGLGTLEPNLIAGIRYAQMTGRESGQGLEDAENTLAKLSILTSTTPTEEANILKYSVPLGRAAGIAPDEVARMTGFMQRLGMSGTTAGTGLAQIIMGVANADDPLRETILHGSANDRKTFESALGLKPGGLHSALTSHETKNMRGLSGLGIVDAQGHLTVKDKEGHLSLDMIMQKLATASEKMAGPAFIALLKDAFNVRGARGSALTDDPEFMKKLQEYIDQNVRMPNSDEAQGIIQQQTATQFRDVLKNTQDILSTLATTTLPEVNNDLRGLNTFLAAIPKAISWLNNPLGLKPEQLPTEDQQEHPFRTGWHAIGRLIHGEPIGRFGSPTEPIGYPTLSPVGGSPPSWDRAIHARSDAGDPPAPVTVNVGGITVNGGDQGLAAKVDAMVKAFAKQLGEALSHSIGTGSGSDMSPYTSGGAM